jgi:hypothetical protein
MNKLIYTYALIRALYDQGDDYLDSFWPFAVQALDTSKFIDILNDPEPFHWYWKY